VEATQQGPRVVEIEALLVGVGIGAVLGLIGAGGAVVAVPAFIYLFGFAPMQATTASLAVVAASAASGLGPRLRMGQVRIRQGVTFWALGLIGTFVGARLAPHVPEALTLTGFAAVMLGAAVAMWRKSDQVVPDESPRRAPWLLPLVAMAIGLLTGIFGVGGGFLIVPALVLGFGFPFAIAAGTSLLVIGLNSIAALAFRVDTWSQIPWHVPLLVVLGGLVGSLVASAFNRGIPQRPLERAFAVLLVILAAWMLIATLVLNV
jgi:uncharacterized membrane protein YfcA